MKLYVIIEESTNKVVAISEFKKDIIGYMTSHNLHDKDYFFTKIKNQSAIDSLLIDYELLYLETDEYLDITLTRLEMTTVNEILNEEKSNILTTHHHLGHFITNYNFTKDEKSVLKEAREILGSSMKKKRLKRLISLDTFIDKLKRYEILIDVDLADIFKKSFYLFINTKK